MTPEDFFGILLGVMDCFLGMNGFAPMWGNLFPRVDSGKIPLFREESVGTSCASALSSLSDTAEGW